MYSGFCWQYEQLNRKMCVQKKLCIQDVTLFLHQISVSMSNIGKTKNLKALTDNSLYVPGTFTDYKHCGFGKYSWGCV